VQAVLIFPALSFAVMLIIQFALYLHAQSIAEAAAQDGAAAARRADGSASSGRAAVNRTLDTMGPRMLTGRSVSVNRSGTVARVSVDGRVLGLVPGIRFSVHETAEGPVERFVPLAEAGQ
jgi:Flp pilus assembly protein TadG